MTRAMCPCGRSETELGIDLCAICRGEYEEREYGLAQEAEWAAEAQAEYEASRTGESS